MQKGFSLVELSIVLIIIGLLVAGVSSGSKLITQAKLSALITEYKELDQAVSTFFLTYDALPGDYEDASTMWSGETNGNGDGDISNAEGFRSLRHMSLADIFPGDYNGTNQAIAFESGDNTPAVMFPRNHNYIYLNRNTSYITSYRTVDTVWAGTINAAKAYNIDKKLDDGNPGTGKIQAFNYITSSNITECAARTDTSAKVNHVYQGEVKYMLSTDAVGCTLLMELTKQ